MPLVTCPDCERDISPSAAFCVHCGRPGPFTDDASHAAGASPASYAPHAPGAFPAPGRLAPPTAELQCPRCKMTGTRALCGRCDVKMVPAAFDRHLFPRVPVEYAGFGSRAGAMLVDLLVMAPIIAISIWAYSWPSPGIIAAGALFGLVASQGYLIAMHANGGQTVGKRVLGIRVRRTDGGAIGWREAFLRELPYLISAAATVAGVLLVLSVSTSFELMMADGTWARMGWLGERAPAWTELVSDLVSWLSLVDLGFLLFDKRRRSLRDHLAGTVVVED